MARKQKQEAASKVMGIQRKALAAITRTVKVEYFDDFLTVTYKPDEISPAKLEAIARERKEEQDADDYDENFAAADNSKDLARLLSKAIVHWDMLDEEEMSPLTLENLITFSNALLIAIRDAISEDMGPKAKKRQR